MSIRRTWRRHLLLTWLLGLMLMLGLPVQAVENITYLHNDAAGSPVAATDAAGNVIWRESYRAYGERTRNETASRTNRQFFHGKAFDADSGLAYFGARYYDPVVGRFMAIDPAGFDEANLHSFNRYAYGNNNPYRYMDQDGRIAILIPLVGLVAGGGLAMLANHPGKPYGSGGSIENSVPGYGAGSSARRWDRLFSEEAKEADSGKGSNVRENNSKGKRAEEEVASDLEGEGRQTERQVREDTPFGRRVIDVEVKDKDGNALGGIEVKSGNSRYRQDQRSKDEWLRQNGYPVDLVREP